MDYQNCTEGEDPQCPYYDVKRCMEALLADALALIQQLEKDKDDLLEERELNDFLRDRVKQLEADKQQLEGLLTHMNQLRDAAAGRALKMEERVRQLEAERDAAVVALKGNCVCPECKYFSDDIQDPCRGCKPTDSKFEWRGVQKD